MLLQRDFDAIAQVWAGTDVRKDSIWPAPDWKALTRLGVDRKVAALIKLVRDRLPARPPYGVRQLGTHYTVTETRSDEAVRRDYAVMLTIVRDRLMSCRTMEDIRAVRGHILAAAGYGPRPSPEVRHLVTSVWKDKTDTLQIDYRDSLRAEAMLRDGWPMGSNPNWKKGYSVRGDEEGGYFLSKGVQVVADGFPSADAAWGWLQKKVDDEASEVAPIPCRPPLGAAEAGILAQRSDTMEGDSRAISQRFGLRSIEFGKWVDDADQESLLRHLCLMLSDLALATGLPEHAMGLRESLSISLGARGTGLQTSSYSPHERMIIINKTGFQGDFAYRWGMAFDHWSGSPGGSHAARQSVAHRFASGAGLVRGKRLGPDNPHLPAALAGEWVALDAAMWRADPASHLVHKALQASLERRRSVAKGKGRAAVELFASDNVHEMEKLQQARLSDEKAGESRFAKEAMQLNGRAGEFWSRPCEMFSRSFEAYVSDRLQSLGIENPGLVFGAEDGRYVHGFRGNPYPAGEERRRIGVVLRQLTELAKPAMMKICSGQAWEPQEPSRTGPADSRPALRPLVVHS